MVDCPENNCRPKTASGIFYHEYFSRDRREHNRVGKLFDTLTLRVYKKMTNKNTGKPRQHYAAFKHYCLRLLPDLFGLMSVLFRFSTSSQIRHGQNSEYFSRIPQFKTSLLMHTS